MQGVADHVASLVDNTIIALLSARFIAGKQSAPLKVQVTISAIVYGDLRYIIAVLVINILILLLYTVEAFRTCLWEGLPEEDILDISSLLVGIIEGHVKLVDVSDDKKANGSGNEENIQLVVTSVDVSQNSRLYQHRTPELRAVLSVYTVNQQRHNSRSGTPAAPRAWQRSRGTAASSPAVFGRKIGIGVGSKKNFFWEGGLDVNIYVLDTADVYEVC
ncbi:hypothetical protein BDZ45DRAFT_801612 [Acephala macrosclerotiorum]|nr:hypothetical protein BDZ45DRAFT_801612 [Acephala macrosclerotiorum]